MGYAIYNLVLTLLVICGFPVFLLFALRGRESRAVLRERLGFYPKSLLGVLRGERPIWLHAVSVGEVRSAAGLIQRLRQRFPGKRILLSTSTRAGKEMAVRMDAGADAVVFFPLDHPWVVGRILGQVEPLLLILLETEIWPNLLRLTHRRGIPILLLSGRLSPKAFRRYLWLRPFFSNVVRQFSMVGMQSQEYADRMIRLGVSPIRVRVTGSLKFSGSHKGVQRQRVDLGLNGRARRILVGGSTHRAEEEVLLDVFQDLRARFPGLLLVLAPRHPNRFAEVERLLRRKQVNYVRKSQLQRRDSNAADVIFLDTLGELAAVYGLGEIAFVGGSLVDAGGHNLMEPARWCKPLLFGPHMTNFSDVAERVKDAGGGIEVKGRDDLSREMARLLSDPDKARNIGERASRAVGADEGVVERSMSLVCRYLEPVDRSMSGPESTAGEAGRSFDGSV